MTGSVILDVMIAMAMFYFALSLVCSSLNDLVAYTFSWRANNLTSQIRSLLLNARLDLPTPAGDGTRAVQPLADAVFDFPLVMGLRQQKTPSLADPLGGIGRLGRYLGRIGRAVVGRAAQPAATGAAGGSAPVPNTWLTELPTPVFVQTLLELLRPAGASPGQPVTFADFARMVNDLPNDTAGPLKQALLAIAGQAGGDIDKTRAGLAAWYDSAAEQAEQWYRERMRTATVAVAALFCVGLNVDSVEVANRFYRDAGLRAAIAARPPAPAADPAVAPLSREEARVAVKSFAEVFQLKLGWGNVEAGEAWTNAVAKAKSNGLIGIWITVLAVSMGAPFWHDVVNRLRKRIDPAPAPRPTP